MTIYMRRIVVVVTTMLCLADDIHAQPSPTTLEQNRPASGVDVPPQPRPGQMISVPRPRGASPQNMVSSVQSIADREMLILWFRRMVSTLLSAPVSEVDTLKRYVNGLTVLNHDDKTVFMSLVSVLGLVRDPTMAAVQVLDAFEVLLEQVEERQDAPLLEIVMLYYERFLIQNQDVSSLERLYLRAISSYSAFEYPEGELRARFDLIQLYTRLNASDLALSHLRKVESQGNIEPRMLCSLYNSMGAKLGSDGNVIDGIALLKECLAMPVSANNYQLLATVNMTASTIYRQGGKDSLALTTGRNALAIFEQYDPGFSTLTSVSALIRVALMEAEIGDRDTAAGILSDVHGKLPEYKRMGLSPTTGLVLVAQLASMLNRPRLVLDITGDVRADSPFFGGSLGQLAIFRADALNQLGRTTEAVELYRRALDDIIESTRVFKVKEEAAQRVRFQTLQVERAKQSAEASGHQLRLLLVFLAMAFAFTLGMLILWFRYRGREREVQERTRLARELHDDLSGTIATIQFYASYLQSKVADQPEVNSLVMQLNEAAIEAGVVTRERIATLDTNFLSIKVLNKRLFKFARDLFEPVGVEVVTVGFLEMDKNISAEQIKALWLALKEVLINALRHGKASIVKITCLNRHDALVITIEDDGEGFDQSASSSGGGITNIRQAGISSKFATKLSTAPGKGTKWTIEIPVDG